MLEADQSNLDTTTPDGDSAVTPAPVKRRLRGVDRATASVAALVALAAGGLYYMHWSTSASSALISDADASSADVQTLLVGGREGLVTLSRNIDKTRLMIDAIAHRDSATLASAHPLERDPFEFRSLEPQQLPNPANTNQAAREAARTKALDAAKALQLQSIMYGSTRRSCLVDGKLYFEGQTIGDFTIGRIAPDAITIQSGEFKFQLRLRK